MRNKTLVALAVGAAMLPLAIQPAVAQQPRPGGGPQAMFEQFDGNNDGVVTRDEVAAFRAERFRQRDIDGDGLLSRDELATAQAQRRQARLDRRIEMLDTDGDGMISEAEMNTRGTPFFDRADADEDGRVTRDEAAQMRRGGGYDNKGGKW